MHDSEPTRRQMFGAMLGGLIGGLGFSRAEAAAPAETVVSPACPAAEFHTVTSVYYTHDASGTLLRKQEQTYRLGPPAYEFDARGRVSSVGRFSC